MDKNKALKTALEAAQKAGQVLIKEINKQHSQKKDNLYLKKGYRQIKSDIDLTVDKLIKKTISKNFPNHNILTEESSKIGRKSKYTWVIDPLCGTIAYLRGIPNFGTSIALLENKTVILSVINDPSFKQSYYALKNKGAFCNKKPIKVSSQTKVKESIIEIQHAVLRNNQFEKSFVKIAQTARRIRMSDSMAVGMAYVAVGKVDAIVNLVQPLYDFAAGMLIIKEAGGKITDFKGKKVNFKLDTVRRNNILGSNGKINDQLIKLLKKQKIKQKTKE